MKQKISVKSLCLCLCLCLITVTVCDLLLPGKERKVYDNVIRLHILANSDSAYDQSVKLKVRDAILAADVFDGAEDVAAAEAVTAAAMEKALAVANETLAAQGVSYRASLAYGEESYPTRQYGDLSLPAGRYKSLRILLGDGEGQNWWCVLFPPLCINSAKGKDIGDIGINKNEKEVFKSGKSRYKFRFKLLEWLF